MLRIETEADIAEGLAALVSSDPRLAAVAAAAGPIPLRRGTDGFEGLAAIITGQQISGSAASAIWTRLKSAVDPFTPENFIAAPEATLRAAGLSRFKVRTLTAVAASVDDGFDLPALAALAPEQAVSSMTALNGIGPWTAECYLLFCIGHPDVFPAGDLALQIAVRHALGLESRPGEKALRAIASQWSPWRGVAARLFWTYYRTIRRVSVRDKAGGAFRRPRSKG